VIPAISARVRNVLPVGVPGFDEFIVMSPFVYVV